jgi:head-tail adaptor
MAVKNVNYGKLAGARAMPAHPGECREPIVLFRAKRSPGEGVSTLRTLTKYDDAWAKVTFGEVKELEGENSEPANTHYFFIRNNEAINVEIRDYVGWGTRLYAVNSTRIMDERRMWLRISTREEGLLTDASFDVGASVVNNSVPVPPVTPPNTGNPYW